MSAFVSGDADSILIKAARLIDARLKQSASALEIATGLQEVGLLPTGTDSQYMDDGNYGERRQVRFVSDWVDG